MNLAGKGFGQGGHFIEMEDAGDDMLNVVGQSLRIGPQVVQQEMHDMDPEVLGEITSAFLGLMSGAFHEGDVRVP